MSGLSQLESDPIFLGQFLRLPLPRLLAHPVAASDQPTTSPAPALPEGSVPQLAAWKTSDGASFRESVVAALSNLDDSTAHQHILPPAAFRQGDLPTATMLPTVYLWCIIQAWQPFIRALKLEDEISLGGHTASGQLRGPLHIGDHLPEHAASSAVPRQLIFRASESGKARGVVIVAEPWSASLPSLFPLDAKAVLGATSRAHLALRDALAYMAATKTHFALVTTYEHFVFLRTVDGTVQVSEPITSSDSEATVYAALWVWAREVAKED